VVKRLAKILALLSLSAMLAMPQEPVPDPEAEPAFSIPMPDWGDKRTWVKAALLAGAAMLVKLSFRKMTEDTPDREE
jgi:hypothetical protein